MKRTHRSRRHRLAAGLLAGSALGVSGALYTHGSGIALADAETVNIVLAEQARTEEEARASQQRIAELDEEASRLLAEYRQVVSETQNLNVYIRQLGAQVESQEEELASLQRQLDEIETTASEVMPLMERMLETLEHFVALDMPFLQEERQRRIANLHDLMRRADVSVSERYRRLVEAYGVEMEYGRTIESYRGRLRSDGAEMAESANGAAGNGDVRTVDFLRLGRVALLYQTLDGRETGYWDVHRDRWVVDNSYQRAVRDGLRIASQQAAPDLLIVPVPTPRENSR